MSKNKKGKTSPKRPTALIALIVVLIGTNVATIYYFTLYQPMVPLAEIPISIKDVTSNLADYIGKVVIITGYIVIGPTGPLLVDHPFVFLNNTQKSDDHLLFIGETLPDLDRLGRCTDVECEVDPSCDPFSDETVRIIYHSDTFRDGLVFPGIFEDKVLDTSVLDGLNLTQTFPIAQKYAILYSGGWRADKAYFRYWNDLTHMYLILQMHGYPADNIYVVYKDGVGEDVDTPVDYPATQASMETVFQELNQTLTSRDTLFFFTTNHGGSSGLTTYWPNGGDEYLNTTEVAGWLDSITCHHMIIVMEQCWSGQFIPAISAPNRVVMTACDDGESSYACDTEGQWDEFVYHFMSALIGTQLPGGIGDANADFIVVDGKISMREAFLYAAIHDSWDETPMYDDDGDGVGLWAGPVFFGSGFYGDNIFL